MNGSVEQCVASDLYDRQAITRLVSLDPAPDSRKRLARHDIAALARPEGVGITRHQSRLRLVNCLASEEILIRDSVVRTLLTNANEVTRANRGYRREARNALGCRNPGYRG